VSKHMSKADRRLWAEARTLADVGELTARWLEGRIDSQPGYCGPSDVDDPARLVPLLAKLCRAGFVTTCSQIGGREQGANGTCWEQCAAVEGFVGPHLAFRLAQAAENAALDYVLHDPVNLPRWRYRYHGAVTVTRVNGRPFTGFGANLPRRHIRDDLLGYGICHPDAVDALCSAWQVTLIDPEWGREPSPLWDMLAAGFASEVRS